MMIIREWLKEGICDTIISTNYVSLMIKAEYISGHGSIDLWRERMEWKLRQILIPIFRCRKAHLGNLRINIINTSIMMWRKRL